MTEVWVAAATPLDDRLHIDHPRLTAHLRRLLAAGADGVVVFGTTGEAPSFAAGERSEALHTVLGDGIDPARLIVGTGSTSITEVITATDQARPTRGALVIPPFYFKDPSRDGVFAFYDALLAATSTPIYLYNFPRLSGVSIDPDVVIELRRRHPGRILGMKDSSGSITSLHRYGDIEAFELFVGTERLLVENARRGGAGVISATANVSLAAIMAVRDRISQGEPPEDEAMLALRDLYERAGSIPAIKATLSVETGHAGWRRVRPPLVALHDAAVEDLEAARQKVRNESGGSAGVSA